MVIRWNIDKMGLEKFTLNAVAHALQKTNKTANEKEAIHLKKKITV
jgi:hypothetical protein